ncbi:MAG: hypothetical protein OXE76_04145 [Alphaproteobacteria bacterium]|nr:hypothetical protein [Alphaproteobacteria bacterium]
MTRAIPQTDSAAPVNPAHLLAVFDPNSDDPIAQTIADVLASGTAGALVVQRFVPGSAYARGQLASDASDKIYVCITAIAAGSAASRVALDQSRNWKLTTGFAGQWVSGNRYTQGSIVEHSGVPYLVRADVLNSVQSPPNDPANFLSLETLGNQTRYTVLGTATFDLDTAGDPNSQGYQWAEAVAGTPQTFDAIYFVAAIGTDDVPLFLPRASALADGRTHDLLMPEQTYLDRAHASHSSTTNSGRHLSLTLRPSVTNAGNNAIVVTAIGISYGGIPPTAGVTNLAIGNRNASTLDIESSTGTDVTLPPATETQAGLATGPMTNKVINLPEVWDPGVWTVGEQCLYDTRIYECIADRTNADTDNPTVDTTGWAQVGTLRVINIRPTLNGTTLTISLDRATGVDLVGTVDLAALEEWRGSWGDLAGQNIRAGDILEHTGRYYICRADHLRQQNGPDTNSRLFALINNWGGAYSANGFYHSGTIVTYNNALWANDSDVLDSDPNPDDATNTKWHRLSPLSLNDITTLLEGASGDDRLDASAALRNFPVASADAAGIIELATNAEADAGADGTRAMTPAAVRRQIGPRISQAEIAAAVPETNVRQTSPSDIVGLIAEHAGGLTQTQVLALFAVWARVDDNSTIPVAKLPADVVLSAELSAAIANFQTAMQVNALITTALNGLDALTGGDPWNGGTAYTAGSVVRHGGAGTQATYLCIADVAANVAASEPGVGADWRTSWWRIGFEEGPPNALVGATVAGRTVTFQRESTTNPLELNFPVEDRTERGESITMRAQASAQAAFEARPIAADPLSVVLGEGANSILSGVNGNDVMVAAGFYLVKAIANVTPAGGTGAMRDGAYKFDVRDASDDSVLSPSTTGAIIEGGAQELAAIALLNLPADTLVNHQVQRTTLAFAANWTITYWRYGEAVQTGIGNVQAAPIGAYTPAAQVADAIWADTGIAAPATVDNEDMFFVAFDVGAADFGRGGFTGAALNATPRVEAGAALDDTDDRFRVRFLHGQSTQGEVLLSRNAAGNFVIGSSFDFLETDNTFYIYQLRAPRGERGLPGRDGWGPPTLLGTAMFDLDGTAQQLALTDGEGNAIVIPESGRIITTTSIPTLGIEGKVEWYLAEDLRNADMNGALSAGFYTNDDNELLVELAVQSGMSSGNRIIVEHIGDTTEQSDAGTAILPSIARFDVTGDLTPSVGSIAGNVYEYDASISQSGHASAARIVGFPGSAIDPAAVTVLATLDDLHSESGRVTIPAGVQLAEAGDTYTIRLEVYTAGQDPATTQPRIYHDARIRAVAATARVHFGFVQASEDETDIDFSTDDIDTRGVVAGDYMVSGIPDAGEFRVYWAVPTSAVQPRNWLVGGVNFNSTIDAPVEQTIDGVAYNVYLSVTDSPFDSSGNGTTYVVS